MTRISSSLTPTTFWKIRRRGLRVPLGCYTIRESAPETIVKALAGTLFWVSVLGMIWLAFVWPVAVGQDPASPILRVWCLATLWAFLVSMAGLLTLRGRASL